MTLRESLEELDRLPSISPVRRGWISSGYGSRKDPFTGRQMLHRGMDVSAWTGTPVYATADGRVNKAGRAGTLGLLVEIDHVADAVLILHEHEQSGDAVLHQALCAEGTQSRARGP